MFFDEKSKPCFFRLKWTRVYLRVCLCACSFIYDLKSARCDRRVESMWKYTNVLANNNIDNKINEVAKSHIRFVRKFRWKDATSSRRETLVPIDFQDGEENWKIIHRDRRSGSRDVSGLFVFLRFSFISRFKIDYDFLWYWKTNRFRRLVHLLQNLKCWTFLCKLIQMSHTKHPQDLIDNWNGLLKLSYSWKRSKQSRNRSLDPFSSFFEAKWNYFTPILKMNLGILGKIWKQTIIFWMNGGWDCILNNHRLHWTLPTKRMTVWIKKK